VYGEGGDGRPPASSFATTRKKSVSIMLMLFRRKAIIPVWFVVFGFVLFASPITLATAAFVILTGAVALTIVLVLWKAPPATIAEVLHHVDASRTV
jgi:hypothetical protein